MMVQTIVNRAESVFSQTRNNVFFEITLQENIKEKPYLIIDTAHYGDEASELNKGVIVQPKSAKGNTYFFEMKGLRDPGYFSLLIEDEHAASYILKDYHYEVGDNVAMKIAREEQTGEYDVEFSGIGSGKYRCISEFPYIHIADSTEAVPLFNADGNYNPDNVYMKDLKLLFAVIEKYQPEMSDYTYALLKADMVGKMGRKIIAGFYHRFSESLNGDHMSAFMKLANDYRAQVHLNYDSEIPDQIKRVSKEYPQLMVEMLVCNFLERYTRVNYNSIFNAIRNLSNSDLSDKLTVTLFVKYSMEMKEDYRDLLDAALLITDDLNCLHALEEISVKGPASFL